MRRRVLRRWIAVFMLATSTGCGREIVDPPEGFKTVPFFVAGVSPAWRMGVSEETLRFSRPGQPDVLARHPGDFFFHGVRRGGRTASGEQLSIEVLVTGCAVPELNVANYLGAEVRLGSAVFEGCIVPYEFWEPEPATGDI